MDNEARYAVAIVSIAKSEKKLDEYKLAIRELDSFFSENADAKKYLESYFVSSDEKFGFIDKLCNKYKLANLNNFLKLITSKHLVFHFHDIAKAINKQINEELGVDEGFVYSVEALSIKQKASIEDAISKKRGHKVELTNKLDPRLIGGIKVVVHDHVYDCSIKGKLETLKNNLNERRTN